MNKATEVLTIAKEILENEVEWCQEHLYIYDPDGDSGKIISACARGCIELAICRVCSCVSRSDWMLRRTVSQEAERRFMDQIPGYKYIPDFNDDEMTSKEDVLLAFKRAIGN